MARKPNYQFERHERERQQAEKKANRLRAKAESAELRKAEQAGTAPDGQAENTD